MKLVQSVATVLIALCAIPTCAIGQNVYRCGNAYSQKPCADGVVVDVQDARTAEQKAESDALIKRDSAAANAMEKARLKEEAQQRADNAKLAAAAAKKASAKPKTDGAASAHKTTVRKVSIKKKAQPEHLPASSTPEKPKKAASAGK